MTKIENEESKFFTNEPDKGNNDGILALAHAVLGEPDEAHLSLEETGAAEELLALASEVSFSSPINRETIQTPLETETNARNNQNDEPPVPGQKPNTTTSSTTGKHICNNCAATSTPFWRKSYDGLYYCNACGLYLRTHNAMRPLSLSKNRESRRGKTRPELCGNCGATDTPMWRKTEDGIVVCNACGLYHKLHGQHRRTGSKRSSTDEPSLTKKPVRSNDFTLVRENLQISSKSSSTSGTTSAKYSLDNQYHHKFDPNRVNVNQQNVVESPVVLPMSSTNVLPVVALQPVDARKLAYLKCSQGRTALLAPKLSQDQHIIISNNQPSSSASGTFISSSPMPPIISSFINSLAMTSPDNLTADQVEHPLQPLLTSIVSQKLKEQKDKYQGKIPSPTLQTISSNAANIPNPMQIYHHQRQQQQQQQENFNQLAEFLQTQQQAIYNQQMIQQEIYNHANENNGYVYNPEYTDSTGYVNYQHGNDESQYQQFDLNNQYVVEQQQSHQPHLQCTQHQSLQSFQNIQQQLPQIQLSQIPQIPQYSYDSQQQQQQQQQQQNGAYFTERFPEPPLRRLSPFSGIKFDKSLIDLVNMQFWQDNNGTNSSQENPSDQNNNVPF